MLCQYVKNQMELLYSNLRINLDELSNSDDDQGKSKQETQLETSRPSNKNTLDAMSKPQQRIDNAAYCICRRSYRQGMMNCCNCEEWFHPECIKLSIDDASKFKEKNNWICPNCSIQQLKSSFESTSKSQYKHQKNRDITSYQSSGCTSFGDMRRYY